MIAIPSVSRAPAIEHRDIAARFVALDCEACSRRSPSSDRGHRSPSTEPTREPVDRRPAIAITDDRRAPNVARALSCSHRGHSWSRPREHASRRPRAALPGRACDPEAPIPAFSSDFPTPHRLDRRTGQLPPYGASTGALCSSFPLRIPWAGAPKHRMRALVRLLLGTYGPLAHTPVTQGPNGLP